MRKLLRTAVEASIAAGKEIMKIYQLEDFQVQTKADESPLTLADQRANEIINKFLCPSKIPIISEENIETPFEERKQWRQCWIVDPLDGTKEFIKKNDEFTVNIALVAEGYPVLGVIYAPALKLLYFSIVSEGKAYKAHIDDKTDPGCIIDCAREIQPNFDPDLVNVVGSRSHMNEETLNFVEHLKTKYEGVQIIPKGSSLKFCLLAEGMAQFYPRFGPTMEWDTAAGQAICEAVGIDCIDKQFGKSITYNRKNLRNGNFCLSYEG